MIWIVVFVVGVALTLAVPGFGATILGVGFVAWMLAAMASKERP